MLSDAFQLHADFTFPPMQIKGCSDFSVSADSQGPRAWVITAAEAFLCESVLSLGGNLPVFTSRLLWETPVLSNRLIVFPVATS